MIAFTPFPSTASGWRGRPSLAQLVQRFAALCDRYAAGQYGKTDEGIHQFARIVERLAEAADEAERRG